MYIKRKKKMGCVMAPSQQPRKQASKQGVGGARKPQTTKKQATWSYSHKKHGREKKKANGKG